MADEINEIENGATPEGAEVVAPDQDPEPVTEQETETAPSIDEAVAKATSELNQQLATLTASLTEKDGELKTLKAQNEQGAQQIASLREGRDAAVGKYRTSLSAANPTIPQELIAGDTIETIDASLETAKSLVARIREGLEVERESESVPAGAPPRTSPGTEDMSPRQKISYALGLSKK